MQRIALLLALVAGIAGCAMPRNDWSAGDQKRELALFAALAADAATTSRIADNPHLSEANALAIPFLGEKPDERDVLIATALLGYGYHYAARRLPPKWRMVLQYVAIGGHVQGAAQNCDNGLC